jgi:excinuclease ABC subunit C
MSVPVEPPTKPEDKITQLKEIVSQFPTEPGVYLMKNAIDKIIYVGKAKVLRARVRSYFNSKDHSTKTRSLVNNIDKIDYMVTKTEVEAFLLEASLIKKHRPKYNIRLKDDKAYPYIRVSLQDDFPRLYLVRKARKDGSLYFGPFTSGLMVHETIKFLNRTFQIRDCGDHYFRNRTRPCLTHQIGYCTAPCVGLINKEDYRKDIESALLLLKGKDKQVVKELTRRMKEAAKEEHFEKAGRIRDSIEALRAILEKQSVIDAMGEKDQDVIGFEGDERGCTIEVLHVRQGRLLGSQSHFISVNPLSAEENPQEWLVSFLNQYYESNMVPDEVLLPVDLGRDLHKLLEAVLEERGHDDVSVRFATDDEGQRLTELANRNAAEHFKNQVARNAKKHLGLDEIREKLNLKDIPMRIECYDISNFQGEEAVASQVVFEEGIPNKDHYRRYKIKTVQGANDFAMMKEVLSRRLAHIEDPEPDLIVVDGGKGQLSVAVAILEELGKPHIPVAGLAKARTLGKFSDADVKGSEERVFLPGRQNPVTFAKNSEALHILVGIRDEAHRFAINYHRKLRDNKTLESELDAVTGLGEKRKRVLLSHFKSVDALKFAQAAEIAELPGFNSVLAERILIQLRDEETNPGVEVPAAGAEKPS